jgi:hypothetical protein
LGWIGCWSVFMCLCVKIPYNLFLYSEA